MYTVYHHCLFGVRYDFLCANYTAFDQTLFNCNFVSNVDCKNSKNFWNRNDDLYKTKSTPPPTPSPVVYTFYTQSPPGAGNPPRRNPLLRRIPQPNININPTTSTETITESLQQQKPITSETITPVEVGIPVVQPRRPPLRRQRPIYDYYDDYEEPYFNRRMRPRPVFYEDDDYYDDRYSRRTDIRRRRPYHRRFKEYEYYDEDDVDEPPRRNRNRNKQRRPVSISRRRKQPDYYYYDDDEEYDERQTSKKPNRNKNRRPDDYDDVVTTKSGEDVIKPSNGGIFDRQRVAPKINLPVPKNVANKYSYKNNEEVTTTTTTTSTTINPDVVTTMRGNFKRPYMNRRNNESTKKAKQSQSDILDEKEEIQESKANSRQVTVTVNNPNTDNNVKKNKERRGYLSRVNMYKTRHSLSTPETKIEDLTDIDDSINEA